MLNKIKKENTGWRLLSWSGFWFIPSGIILAVLAWEPTPGPYTIGENYPYGSVTEAWQVSLGFSWIAFGFLFVGLAFAGERLKSKVLWLCLLICTILALFPHIWLGIMLFFDDPTFASYGDWLIAIPFSILWVLTLGAGFVLAWNYTIA
jgi:hypothetical protein